MKGVEFYSSWFLVKLMSDNLQNPNPSTCLIDHTHYKGSWVCLQKIGAPNMLSWESKGTPPNATLKKKHQEIGVEPKIGGKPQNGW